MTYCWRRSSLSSLWKQISERRLNQMCYNGLSHNRLPVGIYMYCVFLAVAVLLVLPVISALPAVAVTKDTSPNTKESDTVTLTCIVTNITTTETINYVNWKKSSVTFTQFGIVVAADPLNRFSVEGIVDDQHGAFLVYIFRIRDVQREDGGTYTCHVGFSDGNNIPREISVSLQVSVVYFTPPDTSPSCQSTSDVTNLTVGDFFRLTCSTQKGNPIVNVTWTRRTPSGLIEDIPSLTQQNYDIDLAVLAYSFNILQEHNGIELICSIGSEVFPNFHRNCSIGPLVVLDMLTSTTGKPTPTTLYGPSPWIPSTQSPSTSARQDANVSSKSTLLISSNSTIPTTLYTSNASELSDNATHETTSHPVPTPGGPSSPPEGFTLSVLAIIGISAGSLIVFFLICNVFMLIGIFSSQKNHKINRRSLHHRGSENTIRRISRRHSDIIEETEA